MDSTPTRPADRMLAVQGMGDLTHAERTVLTVITWHDGPGGARPSLERIAELAGVRRSTVADHVKALRGKGRLTWSHGRHVNEYTVRYGPAGHCQEIPDGDVRGHCQEIPAGHCQEIPDGNRKAKAATMRKRCRSPDLCRDIGPDAMGQCRVCLQD